MSKSPESRVEMVPGPCGSWHTETPAVGKRIKKKKPEARLWLAVDLIGNSEFLEADKHVITRRASIPARDLRVLGPLFSQSAAILGRERAMLVNMEDIKAIITAGEVLVLNPTDEIVAPFVQELRQMLRQPSLESPCMESPAPDPFPSPDLTLGGPALPMPLPFTLPRCSGAHERPDSERVQGGFWEGLRFRGGGDGVVAQGLEGFREGFGTSSDRDGGAARSLEGFREDFAVGAEEEGFRERLGEGPGQGFREGLGEGLRKGSGEKDPREGYLEGFGAGSEEGFRDGEGGVAEGTAALRGPEVEGSELLPFEFRVLELILQTVLHQLDACTRELLRDATPALDELTQSVSTESLERVRSVKSRMTRLTARVQKVREELEQLLDDDDDMRELYLTRQLQLATRQPDSPGGMSSVHGRGRAGTAHASLDPNGSEPGGASDVEALEMLLEAYFMQVDGTLNKLTTLREYIDDTEDYVNIELDHRRNQLIEFQMHLGTANCTIAMSLVFIGAAGMNVPSWMYELPNQTGFNVYICSVLATCLAAYMGAYAYYRWSRLLCS